MVHHHATAKPTQAVRRHRKAARKRFNAQRKATAARWAPHQPAPPAINPDPTTTPSAELPQSPPSLVLFARRIGAQFTKIGRPILVPGAGTFEEFLGRLRRVFRLPAHLTFQNITIVMGGMAVCVDMENSAAAEGQWEGVVAVMGERKMGVVDVLFEVEG